MVNDAKKIVRAVKLWADQHPEPDQPALMSGLGVFSPRQIAAEVTKKRSRVGRFFVDMIAHSASQLSLKEILQAFERAPSTSQSALAGRLSRKGT
jgi:hypothetical protein